VRDIPSRRAHRRPGDAPDVSTARWRPGGPGVTARLLVLALVPLLGLSALVATIVQSKRRSADVAAAVQENVDRVRQVATFRTTLAQERSLVEVIGIGRSSGVALDKVGALIGGMDLVAAQSQAFAATDAALDETPSPRSVTAGDLAEARAGSGTGPLTERTLTAAYQPLFDRSLDAVNRDLAAVEASAGDVPGGAALLRDLAGIREPLRINENFGQQMLGLEMLFFQVGDRDATRDRLAQLVAEEAHAYAELDRLGDPAVAEAVADLRREPFVESTHTVIKDHVRGVGLDIGAGNDGLRMAGQFDHDALAYGQRLTEFARLSVGRVNARAGQVAEDSRSELRLWTVYGASLIALSLTLSLLIARSITRPLRRLADHADAVSGGDLDVPGLPIRGARDLAVTARAFNDLVDNLRLLDAKARALAELDFDAEALAQPLPGRLGESLQRSASTLSGSVSERDELRSRILYEASYDDVTGLRNRSAAIDQLGQALSRARSIDKALAVLLFDVDGFTRINDTHGRAFGDALLQDVGRRLSRTASVSSLVARVGNDEFAVVIEDVSSPDPVTELARTIVAALRIPRRVEGVSVTAGVSVGIAFSWDGSDDPEQVLAGAGLALSRARGRGPGSLELFDAALQRQLVEQAAIEEALTAALTRDDELFLQYQPVVDLDTGRLTSVEALVRWNRPGMGMQPPDAFIPAAERSPLIVELDRWVLARAARQIGEWRDHPVLGRVDVAVNISGRHITSQTLPAHVEDTLRTYGLDPRRLIVELTETALVEDLGVAEAQLEAVRRLGVRTAIDDFGTGYTSVAQLRQLPVDILKIDRSFVSRLADPTDRALLRMITELGHELGTTTTAEGVETSEQYDMLRHLGCDRAQGFLMCRPLNPEALLDWVSAHATPRP
jgi:diguanylate cyclase (GGDEF)-like protein